MQTLITNSISEAAGCLRNGELVAFPTETVFGLGARFDDEEALKKIFLAKGRPSDNPLILHVSSVEQAKSLCQCVSAEAELLMKHFWPGPLTLVFKKRSSVNNLISAGLDTVALRMPNHAVALSLIQELGLPIAAPSANLSGKPSATKAEHVLHDFNGRIACILEGETVHGIESTVLDCSTEDVFLLRSGSCSVSEIQKLIPNLKINNKQSIEAPRSPGMKYKHYSPNAEVILLKTFSDSSQTFPEIITDAVNSAFIGLDQLLGFSFKKVCICSSPEEYAQNLFSFFRDCDEEKINNIYCQMPTVDGIGLALTERLEKAAGG
jgi:L-threonylcarbamoyladenylate synthase